MLKKIILAATSVAMLAVSAPISHAAPTAVVRDGCGFDTIAQETATGGQDTFTGAAYGYAVFDETSTHTLRCYVTVDGSEVASTPTGSGSVVVTTQGTVTYTTSSTDVDLCTEIDGVTISCGDATLTEFPPQAVIDQVFDILLQVATIIDDTLAPVYDAINGVLAQLDPIERDVVDPIVCPLLASLSGLSIPGVVDITSAGDTSILGEGVWDCPPYGDLFPPS
jgi:hypothetical protein